MALLTKSLFKIGLECPTKIYYQTSRGYANESLEDSFLKALADGGHQVGKLATKYFPSGIDLTSSSIEVALDKTSKLLERDAVVIFEAAVQHDNELALVDILVKSGNSLRVIEVKAKSFSPAADSFFTTRGKIKSGWKSYLCDAVFQENIVRKCLPELQVSSSLMLVNKDIEAQTDGLNSRLLLKAASPLSKKVTVSSNLTEQDLEYQLLVEVPLGEASRKIREEETFPKGSFADHICYLSEIARSETFEKPNIGKICKNCQYRASVEQEAEGHKSGFKNCWKQALGWNDSDFDDAVVYELGSFKKSDEFIRQGKAKLIDLETDDIATNSVGAGPLTQVDRQILQLKKIKEGDASPYVDRQGLADEFKNFTYPLHFIDFETSSPAIPFTRGKRPYSPVAFQFSHHVVARDGSVEHADEFLECSAGKNPNFDFARALKKALETDEGTIFRYYHHENTILANLVIELSNSAEPDRNELIQFLKHISHSIGSSTEAWHGDRDMVDLHDLVKKYFFHPYMSGSTSIKKVLPAILNSSGYVQSKYSKPIYGRDAEIPSKNFEPTTWVVYEKGKAKDPYSLLPKLFQNMPDDLEQRLSVDDSLANGGAALAAYGLLQFTSMEEYEREELKAALLKYCELDTLAMVMIYEAWREWISSA